MNNREFVKKIADSALAYPDSTFAEGNGRVNTCVNPYSYHLVRRHPELYGSMDGLFVDGMTMCWLIRFLWGKRVPRLSFDMSGMAVDLFTYLNDKETSRSIYFLGTKQEILESTVKQFHKSYPEMKIAGYRNGYFIDNDDRKSAIKEVVDIDSDFTIIGMGSPLQEQFALDLKNAGYKGIVFTCGGFLHQSANSINYYPDWVNKYNLRAFYRLFHERGLWGRLYNVLIEFPILFTWDTLCTKVFMRYNF
ncbi:glycosyltransferase [Barnesiella sp. WM24]|uniref:WecB/TagA/CpsF family glycosyltransferase n=1 Tax=Barnesiella sp. WM24 TaxID=2558278 RepID=UPI0010722757|nr:WecB/TagA/CpsF family glycosyltransferase [Barnesiella sp. WM24]TFU94465.1 glycosyltransferase [Barnesiella sp. WM24]